MNELTAKENHLWLIQVFENGRNNPATRTYTIKKYRTSDGLLYVIDPKLNLTKGVPVNLCTIDEVKE